MIGRRTALLAPASLLAGPALAEGEGGFAFRVMRGGQAVGTHTVRFSRRGAEHVAVSHLRVTPTFLGVVVFRYEHMYEEVTVGGRFRRVSSRLNRDGRIVEVRGEAVAGAVLIEGTAGPQRLPANAAPLSWWEVGRLGGRVPLFGTTTGRPLSLAWERRRPGDGGFEYICSGEVNATVHFDAAGRWDGFSARGEDGTDIAYIRA